MARRQDPVDPEVEARALLASRRPPDAQTLILAIRQVNPTGLDLPAAAAARRYALKARLQSLLVVHHRDELSVSVDPAEPATVVLQHRRIGQSACHAVLSALDDDARRWVQLQLDLSAVFEEPGDAPMTAPRAGRPRGVAPRDELARARQCLRDYDYDGAREILEAIVAGGAPSLDALRTLFELLVDTLADDEAAIRIEADLDAAVREHPGVRGVLALAAARAGQLERAEHMVRGVDAQREAEVLLALAEQRLRRDELQDAARLLGDARARDPGLASLLRVERALAEAQSAGVKALEEGLQARIAAHDLDGAAAIAETVLARWPESPLAQRTQREARLRRRAKAQQEAVAEVERALAAGAFGAARERLRAVEDAGGSVEVLAARVAAAEAERRREQSELAARQVLEALARGELDAAMKAWAALPQDARERLLVRADAAPLRWFDATGRRGREDDVEARVAAVLGLVEAERAVAAGDAARALAVIAAQGELLEDVPHARAVGAEARRRIEAKAHQTLDAALRRAEDALAVDDLDGAREALAGGVPRGASAELRARWSDVEHALAAKEARAALRGEHRRCVEAGDALRARALVEQRIAAGDDEDGALRGEWEALGAELRRRWGVEVIETGETPEAWELDALLTLLPHEDGARVVTDAEGNLWAFEVAGREVFVFVCALDAKRVRLRMRWVLPMEVSGGVPVLGDGAIWICALWVAGLRREVQGWTPCAWWSLAEVFPSAARGTLTAQSAGAPSVVWVRSPRKLRKAGVDVLDLRTRRVVRTVTELVNFIPCEVRGQGHMVGIGVMGRARLLDGEGRLVEAFHFDQEQRLVNVSNHPAGGGFMGMVYRASDGRNPRRRVYALDLRGTARTHRIGTCVIEDWNAHKLEAHTHAPDGVMYVSSSTVDAVRLSCIEATPGGVAVRWTTLVDREVFIMEREDGGVPRAVLPGAGELVVEPLDRERPPLGLGLPTLDRRPPRLKKLLCPFGAMLQGAVRLEFATAIKRHARGDGYSRWVTDRLARCVDGRDAVGVLAALHECEVASGIETSFEVGLEQLRERFGDDPSVALMRASVAAIEGRFDDAIALVGDVRPVGLPSEMHAHWHHVAGVAHLFRGDREGAIGAFREGLRAEGSATCGLDLCLALALPVADPPSAEDLSPTAAAARQRVVRATLADRALARGDGRGALEALRGVAVWLSPEAQCMARMAEAWMALDAVGTERFEKARGLGRFVAGVRQKRMESMPLIDGRWDDVRIGDVVERAARWLEDDRRARGVDAATVDAAAENAVAEADRESADAEAETGD